MSINNEIAPRTLPWTPDETDRLFFLRTTQTATYDLFVEIFTSYRDDNIKHVVSRADGGRNKKPRLKDRASVNRQGL